MRYILAIDTSCDDSCLGIYDLKKRQIVINKIISQAAMHASFGGVVPEVASRGHLKNLPKLFNEFFQSTKIKIEEIAFIAVSCRPGLIGSLLIGSSFAKGLAWSLGKKVYGIDHLEAHLLSPLIDNRELKMPYLCYLVSGGHSMAVIVKEVGDYHLLGKTQDDALGEAFDKVAKILGFQYPGGPIVEKVAKKWKGDLLELPIAYKDKSHYNFSYSGLKTAFKRLSIEKGINIENKVLITYEQFFHLPKNKQAIISQLSASFQNAAYNSLFLNFKKILKKYSIKNFTIAGGVASNKFITLNFQKFCNQNGINFYFPKIEYCTDNGAMIAFNSALYSQQNNLKKIENLHNLSRSLLF